MANPATKSADRIDGTDSVDRSQAGSIGGPYVLDEILARGATLHGVPVASVRIETADGRLQELSFRVPEEAEVSRIEGKILKVLQESKLPLTRKQIALTLKLGSVRGRFGRTVSAMVEDEKIYEENELYTDDKNKFGKTT